MSCAIIKDSANDLNRAYSVALGSRLHRPDIIGGAVEKLLTTRSQPSRELTGVGWAKRFVVPGILLQLGIETKREL